jgi:hypothetical protein
MGTGGDVHNVGGVVAKEAMPGPLRNHDSVSGVDFDDAIAAVELEEQAEAAIDHEQHLVTVGVHLTVVRLVTAHSGEPHSVSVEPDRRPRPVVHHEAGCAGVAIDADDVGRQVERLGFRDLGLHAGCLPLGHSGSRIGGFSIEHDSADSHNLLRWNLRSPQSPSSRQ